jgi:fimbrial isopeptide formation D2 family protein/LPXTG-motif cell wall-anchored protein
MKKIVALVLALAMIAVVGLASAASITLNSTATDAQANSTVYTYYLIMKADLSALTSSDYGTTGAPNPNANVVYYVESAALATALDGLTTTSGSDIFRVTRVGQTNRWNVELVATSISGADLATALNVDSVKNNTTSGSFQMAAGETSATQDGLAAGYYMVIASNGTVLVAQTLADVVINEKNDYPNVDKEITGENGTTISATDENDVNIGDTVTYSVPVVIPTTVAAKDIVVHDKMFKGLTLNANSLANDKSVTGLSIVDDDTVAASDRDANYNYYKIVIPAATVSTLAGQTITFTYNATLNANAVINGDNKNTVKLTYDHYTTNDHEVTTKTYKVEVDKRDASNNRLAGVKFTLTRSAGDGVEYYQSKSGTSSVWTSTLTEFETTTTGNIVFDGIDAGTYTLTETFTPAGFNPLSAPITVVVAEDGTVTYTSTDPHNTASGTSATDAIIPVINQSGTTLPSTGGIGTTIFYILGGVLIVAAAVILVARKKASN